MKPTDLPLVNFMGVRVETGCGLGFPTLFLQLPHQLIGGVDVDGLGLMLAFGLGLQETMEMVMGIGGVHGDGESDNVELHFLIPLSVPIY